MDEADQSAEGDYMGGKKFEIKRVIKNNPRKRIDHDCGYSISGWIDSKGENWITTIWMPGTVFERVEATVEELSGIVWLHCCDTGGWREIKNESRGSRKG